MSCITNRCTSGMELKNWLGYLKLVRSVHYRSRKWSKTNIFEHLGRRSKTGLSSKNRSGACAIAHETKMAWNVRFRTSEVGLENWPECCSQRKRPETHKMPRKCLVLQICAHLSWPSKIGSRDETRSGACAIAHENNTNEHFHKFGMALENWLESWKSVWSMCYIPWKWLETDVSSHT
jgi:hypothetical protein